MGGFIDVSDEPRARQVLLLRQAGEWITAIRLIAEGSVFRSGRDPRSLLEARMLVLSLDHLDQCIHWIERLGWPREVPAGRFEVFRKQWVPLRDLRNALEHEEEYLAGRGKYPTLLLGALRVREVLFSRNRGHLVTTPARFGYDTGIEGDRFEVAVLSNRYDVTPALQSALGLAEDVQAGLEAVLEDVRLPGSTEDGREGDEAP